MPTAAQEAPARPRVLVVDDDPGIRMAIRTILETEYTVTEAETIKESLAIFDKQPQDLITLDIQMPEVDGMKGLSEFRHRSGKIPIILISGYRTFELAQEALRLGANDYLTKPFTVQELRQTVKSALTKVYPESDFGPDASDSVSNFMVRLPLQDLMDDKFLSPKHRSHFLAFAQNALADKKRAFETISVSELIHTIRIQFDALHLVNDVDYKLADSHSKLRLECDMYLLDGALANLALTCMLETRGSKAAVEIGFEEVDKKLKVTYQKSGAQFCPKTLATFTRWHQQPSASLDPNSAMLILAEKVVHLHQGELTVSTAPSSGPLVEILLPSHQSPLP
jgi:DNA-binding response OmpR family regulator